MKKSQSLTCDHCGKVWEIGFNSKGEIVKCPHCHKQYQLTKKTKRNKEIAAYASAFVMIFLMSIFFNLIVGQSSTVLIVIFVVVGLVAAGLGRPLGEMAYFAWKGFDYEEVPTKKNKK